MRTHTADPLSPAESESGVEGNARITGTFGAVIFVLLFAEGITVLRVRALISTHAFVGMMLIPFVIVKIASTGYRFVRYYRGDAAYAVKGPPSLFLRVLGPVVVGSTVALLATGVGALLMDRRTAWLVQAHKVSFILWFGAMTVHVVGHAFETPALAIADLRRTSSVRARNAAMRIVLLVIALLAAVVLGVLSIGWSHHWQALRVR
jgi:hypothetical protein